MASQAQPLDAIAQHLLEAEQCVVPLINVNAVVSGLNHGQVANDTHDPVVAADKVGHENLLRV